MTPLDWASFAIASPVGPSSGVTMRTLAPRLMSAVASFSWVWSLPCALSIRYCAWVYPASAKASFRYGWSKLTHRVDDVVSGRITPTCKVVAPLVAKWVSGLNADIVGPMFTVKELMLTCGIVFEPLAAAVEEVNDELQPAAIRLPTATRPTQPTARERRNVPPPCEREDRPPWRLLPSPIPQAPFLRKHLNNAESLHRPSSTLQPGQSDPVPVSAIAGAAGVALRLGPGELTRS